MDSAAYRVGSFTLRQRKDYDHSQFMHDREK